MNKEDFVILIVDDEEGMLEGLVKILSIRGFSVMTAATGSQALSILRSKKVDLAFLDLHLNDIDGLDIVREIQPTDIPIVIMTAFASVESAVSSMKIGVVDYIQKPFDNSSIISIADRFYSSRLVNAGEPDELSLNLSGNDVSKIILKSEQSRSALRTVEKVKEHEIPILLLGESGTGKEVFAKLIHQSSKRKNKPFVGINCSAIPSELLESELFGHEMGAFTGAAKTKPGKFEIAGDGTLFLDEIGDMDIKLQAKLLRVIEEKSFERVGGVRSISFNARVIASTNRDINTLISDREFRSDLYFRLKGVEIHLEPLRNRPEDLENLIHYFVGKYARVYGKSVTVSSEALKYLKEYAWPGNIRELKNVVESAVLLSDDLTLLLPGHFKIESFSGDQMDTQLIAAAERNSIMTSLERNRFNRTLAAKELKISRKTLYNKIKKYSLR